MSTCQSNLIYSFSCSLKGQIYNVNLVKRNILDIGQFKGQKMFHLFETESHDVINTSTKKKSTIINYIKPEEASKINELLKKTTRFDIKSDGSCGALLWSDSEYKPYARFDIKKNKEGQFVSPLKNSNWLPCEDMPTDTKATHWTHYRLCSEDKGAYKWYIKAFDIASKSGKLKQYEESKMPLSVEYMGKKFNWNHSDSVEDDALIVIHGSIGFEIPVKLRTYEGIRLIFETVPTIEGIVAYTDDGIFKIRRNMYESLSWPGEAKEFVQNTYSLDGITNLVALK
jgi:uncharacterized protein YegP (UPF0339 family)